MSTVQRSKASAFTLVELLVVIGVIALLISMLMPALTKARRSAQSVSCLSNLRQIGMGVIAYAGDNRMRMPVGEWGGWTPAPDSDTVYWHTLINPYIGGKGNSYNTIGLATTTPTISKVFTCAGAVVQRGYLHYSSNPIVMGRKSEFNAVPGIPHLTITDLRGAGGIVLAMDGVQGATTGNTQAVAFMMDAGSPFWGRFATGGISAANRARVVPMEENIDADATPPRGRVRWRHMANKAVNVVYVDGHAESHRQGYLTENNFFPTGWRAKP